MHSKALWRLGLGVILVAGAVLLGRSETSAAGALRIGKPAPEITGDRWINSEALSLAKLQPPGPPLGLHVTCLPASGCEPPQPHPCMPSITTPSSSPRSPPC